MFRFGIWNEAQYVRAGKQGRFLGARVSYGLLDVGEHPTEEQIRIFEDISFTLRTSNGTYRTTFRERLRGVDVSTAEIVRTLYPSDIELLVQDRAVSHGLTSLEWAQYMFRFFPNTQFEASDTLLYLIQLSLASGEKYIFEPQGQALQYIDPPFVVGLCHAESFLLPLNRLVAARARRRLDRLAFPSGWVDSSRGPGYEVSKIPCVHPEVLAFARTNPQFQLRTRSIFDVTPNRAHVLRTMNILNRDYFSERQLKQSADVAFSSLRKGGLWIVGRTLEDDFTNHVTFLQKAEDGWKLLTRIGNGSEVEEFVGPLRGGRRDSSSA